MTRRELRLTGLALLLGLIVCVTPSARAQKLFEHGLVQDPARLLPDVALKNHDGSAVRLSDFRGRWLWVFIGYTFCPDVCPTALAEIVREYDTLGDAKESVRVLFVSVDPGRDTPERLKEYVRYFHPDFIGLTGVADSPDALVHALGARYKRRETGSAGGYLVDHTTYVHIVDPNGRLRARYPANTEPGKLAGDFWFLKGEKR